MDIVLAHIAAMKKRNCKKTMKAGIGWTGTEIQFVTIKHLE
jgi:hypothetical protein